jgi:hypothetical protein
MLPKQVPLILLFADKIRSGNNLDKINNKKQRFTCEIVQHRLEFESQVIDCFGKAAIFAIDHNFCNALF